MPNGRVANAIRFDTAFVAGSTRTTRPRTRSDVQTEPAAESTIPDSAPTGTFAIGVTGAAAPQTAATPAAAATSPRARVSMYYNLVAGMRQDAINGPHRP